MLVFNAGIWCHEPNYLLWCKSPTEANFSDYAKCNMVEHSVWLYSWSLVTCFLTVLIILSSVLVMANYSVIPSGRNGKLLSCYRAIAWIIGTRFAKRVLHSNKFKTNLIFSTVWCGYFSRSTVGGILVNIVIHDNINHQYHYDNKYA